MQSDLLVKIRDFILGIPVSNFYKDSNTETLILGSEYGQKAVENFDGPLLVVSAGAGDDFSWEISMMRIPNVQIALLDPTPLSAELVNNFKESIPYNDVVMRNNSSITFFNCALWRDDETIALSSPKNALHNDFSIKDLQNTKTFSLISKAITVRTLMQSMQWDTFDVLKLDIEGAALEVLQSTFSQGYLPKQILVEIDELFFPSIKNYVRTWKYFRLLRRRGYVCIYRRHYDFSFKLRLQ